MKADSKTIAAAIFKRATMTPLEGARLYADGLSPGDHIIDELDECIIGKFRHLLRVVLRDRGMDLELTAKPGVWLVVVSQQRPMVPTMWMPIQREKAVA